MTIPDPRALAVAQAARRSGATKAEGVAAAEQFLAITAAVTALQADIQVAICRSCNGHRTQGMVLEPYASLPCLRCRGEGITHEVPPARYEAVLAAVLDALGGADIGQIVKRLAPLTVEFNAAASKEGV